MAWENICPRRAISNTPEQFKVANVEHARHGPPSACAWGGPLFYRTVVLCFRVSVI